MKKKTIITTIIAIILFLTANHYIGTGFHKRTDVGLGDFSVSADGTEMTFNAVVFSSMGFIRGFKDNYTDDGSHYLTFYSTFGGLNSSFGAKNEFVLPLNKNDTKIYIYRANDEYKLVLQKNETTGEWSKP